MATYNIKFKPSAIRELRNLPPPIITNLTNLIQALKENPYPHNAKKLVGTKDTWRFRDGDYRVVYRILGDVLTIEIIRIGHRRDVYR